MSRKAVVMSQDDFHNLLRAWARKLAPDYCPAAQDEERLTKKYGLEYVLGDYVRGVVTASQELDNKINKDLSKVQFDLENVDCEPDHALPGCAIWTTSTGVPTLLCCAGGDWEDPVYFVLYPESETSIRAYLPKEGNTYVLKTLMAYGNDPDDEGDDGNNPRKFDLITFRAAVEKRLTV